MPWNKEERVAYSREYYQRNRERILEQARLYRQNNPEKRRKWRKQWNKQNTEKVNESVRKWTTNNPEKKKAQHTVKTAKVSGKLVAMPCIFCGTRDNLDAHHPDYSKPLEVVWMCRKHHMEHHTRKREISEIVFRGCSTP